MQKIYDICLSAMLLLILLLLVMSGLRQRDENLAARIAPEILRFHVLANSNSPEDQTLKLEVKDLLLKTIRTGAEKIQTNAVPASSKNDLTREHLIRYMEDHQSELERTAIAYIKEKGYTYLVDIQLEACYFPQKTYGDMTFPAGIYDAVRVQIGEGKGQNFWCVLYPTLCYLDSTYAVVPESSKETLQTLIAEEDFLALLSARRLNFRETISDASHWFSHETKETEQESSLPRLNIRFKLLEYIGQTCKSQE